MIEIKDNMTEIVERDEIILKLQDKIDTQYENLKKLLEDYKALNDKYMALEKLVDGIPDIRIDIKRVEAIDNWFNETSEVTVYDHGEIVENVERLVVKYQGDEGTTVRIDRFF